MSFQEHENKTMSTEKAWKVNIKDNRGSGSWEISVVRANNEHGQKSYGWFDKDKHLIGDSGGPCQSPILDFVWDRLIQVAHQLCDFLNDKETSTEHVQSNWKDTASGADIVESLRRLCDRFIQMPCGPQASVCLMMPCGPQASVYLMMEEAWDAIKNSLKDYPDPPTTPSDLFGVRCYVFCDVKEMWKMNAKFHAEGTRTCIVAF